LKALLGGLAVWLILRAWAALRPSAFPYFARSLLDLPRPFMTANRLVAVLAPSPGERILEVGPGTGRYTVPVAARIGPEGRLQVLDVRQSFLDHTIARARRRGYGNVVATRGSGAALPFPDRSFDAAYLVSVLGEIPDPTAALAELRRVLKPGGRLVIGEILLDPDFPRFGWLVGQARAHGLLLERRTGSALAYFARFTPAEQPRWCK
jgi:ubiquinone/menaquinone biosynthesis C-methylase UbiE